MGVPPASADAGATDRTAIRITYRFADYVTLRAVPDLTVLACGRTDVACASPLASTTTDQLGIAVLQLAGNAFDGYAEVSGAGYGPVLLYMPPLSKDFVTLTLGIVTNAQLQLRLASIAP